MRVVNRLLAVLLAIGVVLAAAVTVLEVSAQRANHRPLVLNWPGVYDWATRTTWGAAPVLLLSIGLTVTGVLLLATQLTPRRPDRLPISCSHPATDAAITRSGLARSLRRAVTEVDGVSQARVTVRRRRARIRVTARAGAASDTGALRTTLTEAARRQLDALGLTRPPALSVKVTAPER
ncbi:DUF6286 domain-containing protein [Actinoplanes awajinensis]|uniref:DUF6286 domain-containing protein n=1 Tax=Actinoplanes awajinensis subsp. mycoplanecinus TaxID=135947 RepID=A0A0X3VAG5_9ACTN|nr:DUF6286 domain-containing protein [Actinoplanes awajinensis]KUL41252.1 hypothetical protein ADL15_05125 [Actinoplanes awajinensis subsp. mycoplanecinus]